MRGSGSSLQGLGSAVVLTDVAHELAGQILSRGEELVGNDIVPELGKRVFCLVEPGGVGRNAVSGER